MPEQKKPILDFRHVDKVFWNGKRPLQALTNITLSIAPGETLGLVGESGCGKSTVGKIALGLETPTSGSRYFLEKDLAALNSSQMRLLRRQMQVIFQDPYASLNPRMNIEEIIGEGIDIHKLAKGQDRRKKICDLLSKVALDPSALPRYPHEFSGGQRQRIAIARALAVDPLFLVCDEPLSALDACTQQQVMQLLIDLKREKQLSYLFISHDLHAIRQLSDTVAVMYLVRIVEQAPAIRLFKTPAHPYTQALLSAVPIPDPVLEKKRHRLVLHGELPSPLSPPQGCPFHPRCPYGMPVCKTMAPPLLPHGPNHLVACHAAKQG